MRYTFIYYIAALLICCSCVDKFEADLSDSESNILAIEGDIISDSACVFKLTHSVPLNTLVTASTNYLVDDAEICVKGSDGQSWKGSYSDNGNYTVPVGTLSTSSTYWLEVTWNSNTYASSPMTPLATPDIESLSWERPNDDDRIDILITPAGGEYLKWNYVEYWKISTPLDPGYAYYPDLDTIDVITDHLNVGYCQDLKHATSVVSNADYTNGKIKNYRLYELDAQDQRCNTRYYTRVTQMAITKEEYEYENLSEQLSDEMGGLFTPQPSALPTNITCQTADLQVIGFVGVSLNVSTKHLYINHDQAGYRLTKRIVTLSESAMELYSWRQIYNRGYRVASYLPLQTPPVSWVERWCVDCTDTYWGASLTKPDFWVDVE